MKKLSLISILFLSLSLFAQKNFQQTGIASFYGDNFEGNYTSSGEKYAHNKYTAAHLTLPMGTNLKVTNLDNGKTVVVKVNDRGPFIKGRIIDLSKAAAADLGFIERGTVHVKIESTDQQPPAPALQTKPIVSVTPYSVPGHTITDTPSQTQSQPQSQPQSIADTEKTPASGMEIFQVSSVQLPQYKGFGLQVGSFKESANFLRNIADISSLTTEPVHIVVLKAGDETIYKLIIGQFEKRREAEKLKNELKHKFPGAFIFTQ